jgi:fatty acid-binding protein DegV
MQTVVVTDSSGSAPLAPGVRIVPITVLFPDREVPDHSALTPRVLAALRDHAPVKTRAPSVVDYVDAIEADGAATAAIITPASELTAMWGHARQAIALADRPAAVVDSRTAGTGQALVVEAARRCAAGGGSLADVVAAADRASRRVRLVAAVGSPGHIAGTGIVPSPPGARLDALGGRPLLRLAGGTIDVVHATPLAADPVPDLVEQWRRDGGPQGARPVVFTAGDDDRGARLARLVGAGPVHRPSAAMTVYTGAGVLGLAWLAPPGRSPR